MNTKLPAAAVILLLALVLLAGCICPPTNWEGPVPPWCSEEDRPTPGKYLGEVKELSEQVSGVGLVGVEFIVQVPENTPEYSTIYLEIWQEASQSWYSLEMEKRGEFEWGQKVPLSYFGGQEAKYRYMRNGWGFVGAEEFSPDSKSAHRTASVGEGVKVEDEVEKWRWAPEPGWERPSIPSSASMTEFKERVDGEKFLKIATLVDFYWDNFDELLPSTHEHLKQKHVEFMHLMPPWDYSQVNPLPIISYRDENLELSHTYPDKALRAHLEQIKRDGLEIVLSPQICCQPYDHASFTDEWWDEWFDQYERYVLYFADLAEEEGIEYLILSGDWVAITRKPENYRQRLESIYAKARQRYSGKMAPLVFQGGSIDNVHDIYPNPADFPFMDEWDFIALNLWVGLTDKNNPTQEELNENVKMIFESRLRPLYETYGLPVLIQSIAYPSVDGGLKGEVSVFDEGIQLWNPYSDKFKLDLEEQAMGYEAVYKNVAESEYIIGASPFAVWPDYFPLTKEYNVRGKPAEEVMAGWYESIE